MKTVTPNRRAAALAAATVLAALLPAAALAHQTAALPAAPVEISAQGKAELAAVRAATEKYRDVNVALAEGYIPDPAGHCVTAKDVGLPAEAGGMGIHYLRPDLLGITAVAPRIDGVGIHTDFTRPAILLYEPQADGSLELVGVENLVFEAAWKEAGHTQSPSFLGHAYDHMADDPATEIDEAHGTTAHYDLHVWVFRDNPSGALMPFNPAVTCAHHTHAGH